jgi:hypothetical protein
MDLGSDNFMSAGMTMSTTFHERDHWMDRLSQNFGERVGAANVN